MATKIPIGTAAYFTDFEHGQTLGAANYFTYAEDHDTNYLLLRQTINQMIDEVSAVSGPNATVALDLCLWDDDANPIDPAEPASGVLGAASYEVSVEGGGTLKVRKGQVMINRQKATLIADLTGLTSSGGAGTRWVALDANGVVYIETAASQRTVDLATVTWDGAQFTAGTIVHLLAVLFDGDSWAELRDRAVTPDVATFGAYTFRRGAQRLRALERFLSGHDTGAEGEAIAGPICLLPGAVGTPALVFGDGSTIFDSTTGWYRGAANRWDFGVSGVSKLYLASTGINFTIDGSAGAAVLRKAGGAGLFFPAAGAVAVTTGAAEIARFVAGQILAAVLGTEGAPHLSILGDLDTGRYSPAANELAWSLGGTKRFHLAADQARLRDGAVGAPALTFDVDLDTGWYRPGADRLAGATGGVQRVEFDAEGNLDLPTNSRVRGIRTAALSIPDNTTTIVPFTAADEFDVGAWHDHAGGSPGDQEFTVPTGGDGVYLIIAEFEWDDPAPVSDFRVEVTLNAAVIATTLCSCDTAWGEDVACTKALSAADVVRLQVWQDNAPNSALDLLEARMNIVKLA